MERTVKLTLEKAREWYKSGNELREVALQAFTEKELNSHRSHSWEEFCNNNPLNENDYYITDYSLTWKLNNLIGTRRSKTNDKNLYPTKEYAKAALALAQLLQLRNEWINEWEPILNLNHWCIVRDNTNSVCITVNVNPRILTFPTQEMANEFYNDFIDLLEIAKPLL